MFDSQLVYFALSFIHLLAQTAGAAAQAAEAVQGVQERGETEIQGAQESGVVNTITHNAVYSTGVQCTVQVYRSGEHNNS